MEGDAEYFTHPDRMRGAPGRKQNAMMHLQLKSFESMLQTFLEKHETGSLYRAFAKVIPHNRHVNTLDGLKEFTNRWFSDLEDRHLTDKSTTQRIEDFNQDIKYLKDMKTTFDERIYSVLFEFYYEMVMEEIPQAAKLVERGRRASSEVMGSNLLVMSNTKGYDALNESMPVRKLYDISKDCEMLFLTIHQLQLIDVRWGSLLKSEEVDVELFDPESIHDVKLYPNHYRFGELLRLIPDIMHKTQNAIKLARSWWYQAEKIRRRLRGQKIREDTSSDPPLESDGIHSAESPKEHLPTADILHEDRSTIPYRSPSPQKRHRLDEYHNPSTDYRNEETLDKEFKEEKSERYTERIPSDAQDDPLVSRTPQDIDFETHPTFPAVTETVEKRLKELTTSIALRRMELASETNELEFFNRRQERIRKLRSNMKLADNAIEAMEDELKIYTRVKERLILQLEEAEDYSERRHISEKLKTIDQKVNDIQELSKVSKYRQKLMNSDLKLKLDLKATFTRYQNEVEGRVDLLSSSVQEEEERKDQLEHELMLLHLQDGLDRQDHTSSKDKGILHKNRHHIDKTNKAQVIPRAAKKATRSVPWLESSRESLEDAIQTDYDLDTPAYKESYSPDLLYDHLRQLGTSRDHDRASDYGDVSPDLLKQISRNSIDSGVNGMGNMNHDKKVRRQEGKRNHLLTHQVTQNNGYASELNGFKAKQERSKLSRKTPIPEIHYLPPSSKGNREHWEDPENVFSDEFDYDPHGHDGTDDQDTGYPDDNGSRRKVHRRHPPATTKGMDLPTRNVKRHPRRSLAQKNIGAPVSHLPQLREEDDRSPTAPRTDRTPRMYDPKRESQDSLINSYSPVPLYMPLGVHQSSKLNHGEGGGGSRNSKKAQGLAPRSKIDQPDLLSPLYQQNKKQQRRKPHTVSRIPVKTIY
ncbi:uncharacterized protein LOC129274551 [Lytechinus pictus]|uniref:uncharacterized protein LOC129274551 n=1 Tax=Lytechinus pictus TaxID=7653 RepID=UPI0030BA1C92